MKYYARRITFYVLTLWVAVSLNFFLPRLLPGNPADIMVSNMTRSREVTPEQIETIRRLFGGDPDANLWQQYVQYLNQIIHWDLGLSIVKYPAEVSDLIADALPWTIGLVGLATIISFVVGISAGAWVGWRRGTWVDHIVPATTLIQSLPYFWLALLLVYLLAVENPVFPIGGGYDFFSFDGTEWSWAFAGSVIYHGILPAATIVISSVGGWLLGMRNMMVSTMSEDYITTAEAKGLRKSRILMTYAARNAALPSIAGFGITLGFVVAGSIVMEQVFNYPGVGKLMISAVNGNDYALMQGLFLVITLAVLAANFIMDIVYGFIDPRTRQNA